MTIKELLRELMLLAERTSEDTEVRVVTDFSNDPLDAVELISDERDYDTEPGDVVALIQGQE